MTHLTIDKENELENGVVYLPSKAMNLATFTGILLMASLLFMDSFRTPENFKTEDWPSVAIIYVPLFFLSLLCFVYYYKRKCTIILSKKSMIRIYDAYFSGRVFITPYSDIVKIVGKPFHPMIDDGLGRDNVFSRLYIHTNDGQKISIHSDELQRRLEPELSIRILNSYRDELVRRFSEHEWYKKMKPSDVNSNFSLQKELLEKMASTKRRQNWEKGSDPSS